MELLFELIQVAIGNREMLSHTPSEDEWQELYHVAEKQALSGICFVGAQKLVKQEQGPSEDLYYDWLCDATQIQQRNAEMNQYTKETVDFFWKYGFACCVLKGQSMVPLYGSLGMMRMSGDVDIWLAGGREKICDFSMQQLGRVEGMTYHHIHFPYWNDYEVEPHFIPGYMNNPFHLKRLKRFFRQYEPKDNTTDAPLAFNVIYILQHCYKHFLGRGIGMRQIMDYYFIFLNRNSQMLQIEKDNADKEIKNTLKELGMMKFAGAMMWVMEYVFMLDKKYMICEPNEKEGRFLLNEVMQTGNFGHQDERYDWNIKSAFKRFLANQKWNIHLLVHYPSEIFWDPFFSIYRYFLVKKWMRKYRQK